MARDVTVTLDEMLEACDAIREASQGLDLAGFQGARLRRLAVERAIEIISEAARRLPEDLIGRYPDIPWAKVRAIGNVLRHEYHEVNPQIIWAVVQSDLPALEAVLSSERERASRQRSSGGGEHPDME